MQNRNKNKWLLALAAGLILISTWTWSHETASLAQHSSPVSFVMFSE